MVSSPGRVGSTYLVYLLNLLGSQVVSTHNPWYECDYSRAWLILLKRRNIAASVLSALVGDHTGEWDGYSGKSIEPIMIDCEGPQSRLYLRYMFHRWYWESHDLSRPWSRVEYFYFEDFVGKHKHVFEKLGVPIPDEEPYVPDPSPYRARDIIINYDECVQMIQHWDNLDIEFQPVIPWHLRVAGINIKIPEMRS